MRIVLILFICLSGCFTKKTIVTKTDDGVEFKTRQVGKVTYKDKDIEVELDTRQPSVLEDLIKIWGIRMIRDRSD